MTFAPCTTLVIILLIIFRNGWPAKMGLVPFWQLCTLCFVVVIVQCYCVCIVDNKPSLSVCVSECSLPSVSDVLIWSVVSLSVCVSECSLPSVSDVLIWSVVSLSVCVSECSLPSVSDALSWSVVTAADNCLTSGACSSVSQLAGGNVNAPTSNSPS